MATIKEQYLGQHTEFKPPFPKKLQSLFGNRLAKRL